MAAHNDEGGRANDEDMRKDLAHGSGDFVIRHSEFVIPHKPRIFPQNHLNDLTQP
jgi:hypothetical protein